MQSSLSNSLKKVEPKLLRWQCDENLFEFNSTEDVEELDSIVGQPRAIEAIRMGAELWARGYNIFVTGLSGTGRMTAVEQLLQQHTTHIPKLYDFCYVNNFKNDQQPILIKLDKGEGKHFSKAMDEAISYCKARLPKLFEEDPYQSKRKQLIEEFQESEKRMLQAFDEELEPLGFVRGHLETEQGIMQPEVFPVINGKPVQIEYLDELLSKGKLKIEKVNEYKSNYKRFHDRIFEIARQGMKMMKEFKLELAEHDKNASRLVLEPVFTEILERFQNAALNNYINEVRNNILENLAMFVPSSNPIEAAIPDPNLEFAIADYFNLFKVNVVLDNSDRNAAPIIIERNPNYSNLFGTFDKVFDQRGFWKTDFTKIRAGSILQADQGYLIVNAQDLFYEYGVWNALKKVLLYGVLEIQMLESFYQISVSHIKPEPIETNIKVIIIGGQTLYNMLYDYEKGFKKIFKVNAQFDYETELSLEMIHNFAKFVAKICNKEKLPHCTPSGVSAIVEWAVKHAGSQQRITLKFSDVADILREAAFYDKDRSKDKLITREDVENAIEWRRKRNDLIDEKLRRYILEGTILIDTETERIGQINGLTVMDTGLISFGKPARITCTVGAGNSGVINIEREAQMSGAIYNKGAMIITGFMIERFAQNKPLAFSASLTFEQSYGGIDGDSASVAEIYVLMSALSKTPINQSIAITGSINQKGDVQPIGGVNEKISGFYEICKSRGFNKKQGVIIPIQNVKDLMLDADIISSVENGDFTIWSMSKIEDPSILLTGLPFGDTATQCEYESGTLLCKVRDRLEELRKSAEAESEEETKAKTPKKKASKRKANVKKVSVNFLRNKLR